MRRNPAQLSIGLRKHCARHWLPHLPLFGYGIAKTKYFDRQSPGRALPERKSVSACFRQKY
jgi:hypothetical protein